jgi:hypothetical protein
MAGSGDSRPAIVKSLGILSDTRTTSGAQAGPIFFSLGVNNKLHRMEARAYRAPAGANDVSGISVKTLLSALLAFQFSIGRFTRWGYPAAI